MADIYLAASVGVDELGKQFETMPPVNDDAIAPRVIRCATLVVKQPMAEQIAIANAKSVDNATLRATWANMWRSLSKNDSKPPILHWNRAVRSDDLYLKGVASRLINSNIPPTQAGPNYSVGAVYSLKHARDWGSLREIKKAALFNVVVISTSPKTANVLDAIRALQILYGDVQVGI